MLATGTVTGDPWQTTPQNTPGQPPNGPEALPACPGTLVAWGYNGNGVYGFYLAFDAESLFWDVYAAWSYEADTLSLGVKKYVVGAAIDDGSLRTYALSDNNIDCIKVANDSRAGDDGFEYWTKLGAVGWTSDWGCTVTLWASFALTGTVTLQVGVQIGGSVSASVTVELGGSHSCSQGGTLDSDLTISGHGQWPSA